jgi:Zn-dependent protease
MRVRAWWVTSSALAFCVIVLCAGTAQASGGVNLNGRFVATEDVSVITGAIIHDKLGATYFDTWSFSPGCLYGACATTMLLGAGFRVTLAPSGAGFVGSGSELVPCVSLAAPHGVVTQAGYLETLTVQLVPTISAQGAASAVTGTLAGTYQPTPAGLAHQCRPGYEFREVRATAINGTVRNALPSQRSTIASSLVPITEAFPLNAKTLLNVSLALGALLLVTFPSQIFNRTLDENYEEIRELLKRRVPALARRSADRRPIIPHTSRRAVVLVVLGGAFIGGFNDPTFGVNGHSLETYVGVLLTFIVGIATTTVVGLGYRRLRHLEGRPGPRAIPVGLAVAVGCVIVSRATNFEPGYLYGIVAGVVFSPELKANEKGHEVALTSLATLCVAVVSWAIWMPVQESVRVSHASPAGLIADTLLAALFVSGVINTVFNLLPFESLAGRSLFRWHRGAWAAVFLAAIFLVFEVLLVPAARAQRYSNAPFIITSLLFVSFAAASIGFNRYFAHRHRGAPATGVSPTHSSAPATPALPERAAPPPPLAITERVEQGRPESRGDFDGA